MITEINVVDLKERLDAGEKLFILDVREPHEYEAANIGATLIPLGELPDRLDELASVKEAEFVVHCRSGMRSARACQLLMENGFTHPVNLAGGIMAWARFIDPGMQVD
jgi:adenylyltransferase/sulfurtransferase